MPANPAHKPGANIELQQPVRCPFSVGHPRQSTEASRRVAMEPQAHDRAAPSLLPTQTAELLVWAGATLAERMAREGAPRFAVQEILRRAANQAAALRRGAEDLR
jgi:hypothetical protein